MSRYASSSKTPLSRCFSTTTPTLSRPRPGRSTPQPFAKPPLPSKYIPANAPKRTNRPPAKIATLSRLVSLHHASSSFMPTADDAGQGFDNAFENVTQEPNFISYDTWRRSVLESKAPNKSLVLANNPLTDLESQRFASESYWNVWEKHTPKTMEDQVKVGKGEGMLTEREKRVREVLFGTWERGGMGMEGSKPGLEGVQEWLKAKGVSVEEYAREWEGRDNVEGEWAGDQVELIEEPKSA